MGRRDPRESGSGGMVGERGEPVSAEVSLRELDAPHPRGPRTDPSGSADREGVRSLDRTIRPGGWRIRHGRFKKGHLCTTGNATRALVQFGYGDHPAVRSAFEWLVTNRDKNGGLGCFLGGGEMGFWGGGRALPGGTAARKGGGGEKAAELRAGDYPGGGEAKKGG